MNGSSGFPYGAVVPRAPYGNPELPAGHAVVKVIDTDDFDVDITASGVYEVVAPDSGQVSVAAENCDHQIRVGQFEPQSKRNAPAVSGVVGIDVHVTGHAPRAADAGDHHVFFNRDP